MAIIIERTITIKNDQATLDNPLYLYIGDGDIVCLFTIKEIKKAATFGSINTSNLITENASYGDVRIYKPDKALVFTTRAEIIDDKLQVLFSYDNIDQLSEVGRHQLQIHLYDDDDEERNRYTLPPIDINVLYPIGTDTSLIDEAVVGYSLLDTTDEEVATFDEEGNYNKTEWELGDIITKNKMNKIEDALYEINAADSNFITTETLETELDGKADIIHNHSVTSISGLATVAKTGSYNDLSNKPNMNNYATKTELANKANTTHTHNEYANATHTHNEYAASSHTHTGYATSAELLNKADKSHTHSDYLTQDALTNYATKSYVDNQGFITSIPSAYITESELQTKLADKAYATISYVDASIKNAGGFSGSGSSDGLDLSIYATNEYLHEQLDAKADVIHSHSEYLTQVPSTYATIAYVDEAIEGIGDGGIDSSVLADYYTKDEMDVALVGKANIDHAHDDKYATTTHTHDNYALKEDIPNINEVTIPENISYFTNDAGYVTTDGMNTALSNKADTEHEHAQYSLIDHTHEDYALKEEIPTVPTNISAFTNDSGYAIEENINEAINDINNNLTNNYAKKEEIPTNVSNLTNDSGYVTSNEVIRIEIVSSIPSTEEDGVLYIIIKEQ